MKVKYIEVKRGATISLGTNSYESTRIDVTMRASLDEEDDRSEALATLDDMVKVELSDRVDEIDLGSRRVKSRAKRFGI